MLGWVLRRGENAADTGGDTAQIEQPDTPAPVFAARAFKSALFGTPAPPGDETRAKTNNAITISKTADRMQDGSRTPPQKPQGILLTPGTGTSRRKRVSFGHDVKKTTEVPSADGSKRTRLNEALEKARKKGAKSAIQAQPNSASDDEWEEEPDDKICHHDVTVDLNEPHSQSGKYWKEEFEKYHEDAKAEMGKLLKYKQLAKSYAKQKDTEAIVLAEKLKDEQRKVINMEKKTAEGASQVVTKRGDISESATPELISKLAKQTSLANQFRSKVHELEEQLEEIVLNREDETDSKNRRRRQFASPRAQKTIVEMQRELRRARNQVKELEQLREENETLKYQLNNAEQRGTGVGVKELLGDGSRDTARSQELRAQLRELREESRRKDDELRKMKREFENFKQESQAREEDTKGVLERAHSKIADLKKEIRTLKATEQGPAKKTKSWQTQTNGNAPTEGTRTSTTAATHPTARVFAQSTFDLQDLDDDASIDLQAISSRPRTLRDKSNEDAGSKYGTGSGALGTASTILGNRPDLGKPRWQPFVPRSPRSRAYLGEELTKRLQNGGATSASTKPKDIAAPDLPSLSRRSARAAKGNSWERDDANVDLLQDRFERLGGPDGTGAGTLQANTIKSVLPPERRAAALARIEQRMAAKKRVRQRGSLGKENVRP